MNKCLGMLIGAAIVLTAALTVTLSLSGGRGIIYLFSLLIIAFFACCAAFIGMVRVLLHTIDMKVILECGCVAKTDTTLGGHCPVHGPQRIAAYDPFIFRERYVISKKRRRVRSGVKPRDITTWAGDFRAGVPPGLRTVEEPGPFEEVRNAGPAQPVNVPLKVASVAAWQAAREAAKAARNFLRGMDTR